MTPDAGCLLTGCPVLHDRRNGSSAIVSLIIPYELCSMHAWNTDALESQRGAASFRLHRFGDEAHKHIHIPRAYPRDNDKRMRLNQQDSLDLLLGPRPCWFHGMALSLLSERGVWVGGRAGSALLAGR